MTKRIKKIKIKKQDGTFTDYIPIGAEAEDISMNDGESVQLKLNKKPYYYDTVAAMKADTKLKVGDMAITLGYYSANDGGGAEYKIISSSNKHTETLTNQLLAELIIKDKINVKQFGAYGDGEHDDIAAIQSAINFGKNKTIYFPDNCVFLISSHIYTSASPSEKQFLQLAKNTMIKAIDSFTDDYVIILGETGTVDTNDLGNYITGLDGGTINGNAVAAGICSTKTHLARITNTNVINAKNIGIKIEKFSPSNSSSDAWLENIYVVGPDPTNASAIGLWLDGYDNNILMYRSQRFPIGVKLTGAGNFLKNCHPLYGVGANSLAYYEDSVAFWIQNSDNHFEQCYNDNFSTGWLQNGDFNWSGNQLFNYWYENYNYKHNWIKVANTTYFRGKIDGLKGAMPSNGTNRILINESNVLMEYNFGSRPDNAGQISNFVYTTTNNLVNYYTDEAFTHDILNVNQYTLFNLDYTLNKDTWYPFLFVTSNNNVDLKINLSIGRNTDATLTLTTNNGTNSNIPIVKKIYSETLGDFIEDIQIGYEDVGFDDDSITRYMRVFYFKLISASSKFVQPTRWCWY